MALNYDKLERVWPKLSKEMRVAIACTAVERIRPLYELGNFKLTLGDMGIKAPKLKPDTELVALGLDMGWAFVDGTAPDKALRESIEQWLKKNLVHKTTPKKFAAVGATTCKSIYYLLRAMEDDTGQNVEQTMSMAEVGPAITLRNMGIGDDDNDIPTKVGKKEEAWAMRVVEHALASAHPRAPISSTQPWPSCGRSWSRARSRARQRSRRSMTSP